MGYYPSPFISQRTERSFSGEPAWSSGMTLIFLLDGALDFQVNTHLYQLRPLDFLFFKPYDIYYATHPGQDYLAFVITIERPMLLNACPQLDELRFDLRLLRHSEDDPVYQAVCAELAKVVFATLKPNVCSQLKIVSACGRILTRLVEAYGSEGGESAGQSADYARERAVSILRYISENYTERITLSDIAGHVGLHPQYFSSFFKKRFGANFSDYLNYYRVGQSLHALQYTDESILNIAISNGFNNHKTYSSAFQRAYGMLPREYRRASRATEKADRPPDDGHGEFRFFQRYWSSDADAPAYVDAVKSFQSVTFREDRQGGGFLNRTLNFISAGRALTCLRSDVQQQLRQAKADLDLDYVRVRDIFSDDLFLYYEDPERGPVFNWVSIDSVFDFFLSIGVRPYVELGYMPSLLASKKQFANWQYRPNISAPKSYPAWALLVTRFFEHCIDRYGAEEVRAWYFEFWTTPNLQLERSYWNESQAEFFHFYQVTYEAIRKVDPKLRIGTPNFSYPSGMSWYADFFEYARRHRLRPDFISLHSYCISDGQAEQNRSVQSSDAGWAYHPIAPQKDLLRRQVDELRQCAADAGFGELELIVSDWNVSYVPQDYTRDTAFMAPYFLYCYSRVLDRVKAICVWSLSDIHEEFFYNDTLFHGGPGLVDYYGVPKASYHAVSFAYRLSKDILQVGENYILARAGRGYELIVFNLAFYDPAYRVPDLSAITYDQRYNVYEAVHSLSFHVVLSPKPGSYTILQRKISRESGSSYDLWLKMGKPGDLSGGLSDHLKARCIPDVYVETASAAPDLIFDVLVEPHGATFISIQPTEK